MPARQAWSTKAGPCMKYRQAGARIKAGRGAQAAPAETRASQGSMWLRSSTVSMVVSAAIQLVRLFPLGG
jgi:hypothetical protein